MIQPLNRLLIIFSFLFSSLLTNQISYGQEVHGNPQFWYMAVVHHNLNDRWALGNEFHARFDDWSKDKQTFMLRPFAKYKIMEGLEATGGYTFVQNYPYGFYPSLGNSKEHNIWEQIAFNQSYGKVKLMQHFRWEHRFVEQLTTDTNGDVSTDGFKNVNRLRCRITARVPITDDYFIHVFNELLIRTDSRLVTTQFDRYWLFAGVGKKLTDKISAQLAYLHQYINNNPTRYERHSGLWLTLDVGI